MAFALHRGGRPRSLVRIVAAALTLVVLVGSVRVLGDDCQVGFVTDSELTAPQTTADHSSSGDPCACFCDCGCAGVLLTFVPSSVRAALDTLPAPSVVAAIVGLHDSVHRTPPTRPPRA